MAGLLGKIRGFFRGRPKAPKVPKRVGEGHRGIAAGSLKERYRKQQEGIEPYTQEEIGKWERLSADDATNFVYNGMFLPVHSSNVAAAQYHIDDQSMMVEFLNGSAYLYHGVPEQEAIEFTQAQSKGGWLWDRFRVRGSRIAHKKDYERIK